MYSSRLMSFYDTFEAKNYPLMRERDLGIVKNKIIEMFGLRSKPEV